ncbi:hypothetical protein SPRG_09755 [Saprolegnia parasitica CBS 223.65]|uniref:Uncharacterized protein n=1 Tax=Saprolegnia parasitica (strain CBS 223.65) TaxID=695850 RepID=A0A067CEP0_SAPPC|nr:hypothetical protein SPRG_09755 [Saprolegnia parasitica CBS 223.65]KDO25026.1 hypothetical protein SPRG_09755 [Saprolegnia parasitica CBS 223.65]|eukprot:XP_012204294.1 hypothetical protein SPRG_09755 [Saprolegnia parasitica CBS 223.65]
MAMLLPPDAHMGRHPRSIYSLWHLLVWPCELLTYTALLCVLAHVVWTGVGVCLLGLLALCAVCVDGPRLLCAHASFESVVARYHVWLFAWLKADVRLHNHVCLTSQRIPLVCETNEDTYLCAEHTQPLLIDDPSCAGVLRLVAYLLVVRMGLALLAVVWLDLAVWSVAQNFIAGFHVLRALVVSPGVVPEAVLQIAMVPAWRWDVGPYSLLLLVVAVWYLVLVTRQPLELKDGSANCERYKCTFSK